MPGYNVVNSYGSDPAGENPSAAGYFEFGTDQQTVRPIRLNSAGTVSFGDGTAAPDTTLARVSAGVLSVNGVPVDIGGGTFNVKAYGALGDGSTDDTVAIQAAITAASPTKGTVFFPPGTYRVATLTGTAATNLRRFFTLTTGITLQGASATASVIKAGNSTAPFFAILRGTVDGTDLSGLTVRDLGFDLNTANNAPASNQASNAVLDYRAAVVVYTGTRVTITRCRILDSCGVWGFAVNGAAVTDTVIEGNRLEWASSAVYHDTSALYVSGARTLIRGNEFVATAGTPLAFSAIETHGDNQVITGNIISGWYRGANLTGVGVAANGVIFANNVVQQCAVGVQLWSTAAGLTGGYGLINTTVDHNVIDIDFDAWPSATISGPKAGILLHQGSDYGILNLSVVDNQIRFRTFVAVPGAGDFTSSGVAYYRAAAVTGVTDQAISITRNTITGPPGAGIYVQPKAVVSGLDISGNVVRNPATGGGAAYSTQYRCGVVLEAAQDSLNGVTISRNIIVDDRVSAVINAGLSWLLVSVACTPARTDNNSLQVTDTSVTKPLFNFSASQVIPATPPLPPATGYTSLFYVGPVGARSSGLSVQATEYATPVWVGWPMTITRLGAQVTVIGDVGSKVRLGVRADTGVGAPGALLLDAGTIAGDSATAQEITGLSLNLLPGLVWFTATPQVITVTGPTLITTTGDSWPVLGPSLASALSLTPSTGYATAATVTGALPATYTISTRTGSPPRVVARIN